jgi:predicted ATPase
MAAVLAPLRLLLVLDNCEHVADEVAAFIEAACAAARAYACWPRARRR